jgi:hypothetical protein
MKLSIPILLTALLLLTACGGPEPAGRAASSSTNTAVNGLAEFAKCMREHGQNVPDPDPNSSNQSVTPPSGASSAEWDAAMQACQHFLPNGGAPQAPDARELDGLRAYAGCMREHGIEVSDPDPNTGQSKIGGRLADASRAEIENDPGYRTADTACKDKLATPRSK